MILAADIGGTKLLFGWFKVHEGKLDLVSQKRYPSGGFLSLEDAIAAFLHDSGAPSRGQGVTAACFCVPGPLVQGKSRLVNLGWEVSAEAISARFPGIGKVMVQNDLEGLAAGIGLLGKADFKSLTPEHPLEEGSISKGRFGILAPGTGLGVALLLEGNLFASEGAHVEFGPRDEKEARLWAFLRERYGHVSYERILSGAGLCALGEFISGEMGENPRQVFHEPAEITAGAAEGTCLVCREALEMFAGILGAQAGNLVLTALTLDGVFLGGGMTPKLLPWLSGSSFHRGFTEKGRFSYMMETVPVSAIIDSSAGLYGGGRFAAQAAGHPWDRLELEQNSEGEER